MVLCVEINNINEGVVVLSQGNLNFFKRNMPQVLPTDGTEAQDFDPNRIKSSIFKETSIVEDCTLWGVDPDGVADEIVADVCSEIMELHIKKGYDVITARYTRERTCVALHNYYQKWRSQYTTMGIPWAEFKKAYGHIFDAIGSIEEITPQVITEKILPHMNSLEIINLILRMGKDYIGVRNDIKGFEKEDE